MLEQDQVLPNLIARRAAATPARIAIQCVDGTAMTYGELHAENMRWAAAYRRAGVTAGDHVASMVVHSFASYSVWLGLSWLKAVEVPANTGYRGTMLAYLIENSEARLLVIGAEFFDRLVEVAHRVPNLERVVVLDARGRLPRAALRRSSAPSDFSPARRRVEDVEAPTYRDISSVIYTSGTTGPSKGVLVSWASLQDLYGMLPEDIIPAPDDGYYSVYPAYHVSGKAAISVAFMHDARLVFRESFSLSAYWDDIRRYNCVFGGLVGPMAAMILGLPPEPDRRRQPLARRGDGPGHPRVRGVQAAVRSPGLHGVRHDRDRLSLQERLGTDRPHHRRACPDRAARLRGEAGRRRRRGRGARPVRRDGGAHRGSVDHHQRVLPDAREDGRRLAQRMVPFGRRLHPRCRGELLLRRQDQGCHPAAGREHLLVRGGERGQRASRRGGIGRASASPPN